MKSGGIINLTVSCLEVMLIEPFKWIDMKHDVDGPKSCGSTLLSSSLGVSSIASTQVALKSGTPIFKRIIDAMEAIERLPRLAAVNENITAGTRIELCLAISHVDISVIEGMQIECRLEGNSIILQLKAILDTGSEINIGS